SVWERRHWAGAGIMPRLTDAVAALPYPAELLVTEEYPGAAAHTVLLVRPDGHLVTALSGVRPDELYAAAEAALGGKDAGETSGAGPDAGTGPGAGAHSEAGPHSETGPYPGEGPGSRVRPGGTGPVSDAVPDEMNMPPAGAPGDIVNVTDARGAAGV